MNDKTIKTIMKARLFIAIAAAAFVLAGCGNPQQKQQEEAAAPQAEAALPKVYDDAADPVVQIDEAVAKAKAEGKFVIAQVGGNWCPWCLRFADYMEKDEEIKSVVDENFVYVHINVRRRNPETGKNETCTAAMAKLGNPMRFGYPVMVVLDGNGKIVHTQDSGYLESGESYDKDKVLRFFNNWKPSAIAH